MNTIRLMLNPITADREVVKNERVLPVQPWGSDNPQ